jgi:NhaP-type Na+/H+ or K+/H+ antiporter
VLLLELVLLLMICAVALSWLARHFKFPYPIALVIGGALLGMIPNLPQFPFDPQLILVIVLPPILYQAALLTSWSDFKAHIRSISLLAIGLVIATTLAVGLVAQADGALGALGGSLRARRHRLAAGRRGRHHHPLAAQHSRATW